MNAILALAERVAEVLDEEHIGHVVIGAVALAVHHYPRRTEDLDFAIAEDPRRLPALSKRLEAAGFAAEFVEPDGSDPLGGVITVEDSSGRRVHIVNFDNPPANGFPRLVKQGLSRATPLAPDSRLKVVDLFTLIESKLYAGGRKSELDILELLEANQPIDLDALRAECDDLRLSDELERILRHASPE